MKLRDIANIIRCKLIEHEPSGQFNYNVFNDFARSCPSDNRITVSNPRLAMAQRLNPYDIAVALVPGEAGSEYLQAILIEEASDHGRVIDDKALIIRMPNSDAAIHFHAFLEFSATRRPAKQLYRDLASGEFPAFTVTKETKPLYDAALASGEALATLDAQIDQLVQARTMETVTQEKAWAELVGDADGN